MDNEKTDDSITEPKDEDDLTRTRRKYRALRSAVQDWFNIRELSGHFSGMLEEMKRQTQHKTINTASAAHGLRLQIIGYAAEILANVRRQRVEAMAGGRLDMRSALRDAMRQVNLDGPEAERHLLQLLENAPVVTCFSLKIEATTRPYVLAQEDEEMTWAELDLGPE